MAFGTVSQTKRDVVAEIAALLALCAVSNNDKVGLVLTTDEIERYVPPRKGPRHALRLIRELFVSKPKGVATNLRAGFDFLNKVLHRRALIFAFSDGHLGIPSKRMAAVALYDGSSPGWNKDGGPRNFASFVGGWPDQVPCR